MCAGVPNRRLASGAEPDKLSAMTDPMGTEDTTIEEQYPHEVPFGDRVMRMKTPSSMQLAMMVRRLERHQDDPKRDTDSDMALFAQILDIFQAWWQPVDQQWLEDEMLAGRFDIPELEQLMNQLRATFENAAAGTTQAPKTGPVRWRRGRR